MPLTMTPKKSKSLRKKLQKDGSVIITDTPISTSMSMQKISNASRPRDSHELDSRLEAAMENLGLPEAAKKDMRKLTPDKKWDLILQNDAKIQVNAMDNHRKLAEQINSPNYYANRAGYSQNGNIPSNFTEQSDSPD